MKWISGETNNEGWEASDNDANAGKGYYGACCVEMDIWEANSMATAYTPHPCDTVGAYRCEGTECGDNWTDERYDGICDKDGCDFNSWRLGDQTFYGPRSYFTFDTTKSMTDSITQDFCDQTKTVFDDVNDHEEHGGLKAMDESLDRCQVLLMSMWWDDHDANMLWLDSNYPLDKNPSTPGVNRGPYPEDSGDPVDMVENYPDAYVKYYNVKFRTIGSTFTGGRKTP